MKKNKKKFKWKCKKCKSIQISDPLQRYTLDYCKCKSVCVDAEEHYIRFISNDLNNYEYLGEVD